MLNLFYIQLKLFLSTLGVTFFFFSVINPAQAEETVAYCDTPLHAVNVYRKSTPESTETSLRIRVFWREKSLVFADLPAQRSHFSNEGYIYTSQSGLSDNYSDSLWMLFVPDNKERSCLLFRNGRAFDSGDVTNREQGTGNRE
ncbi:MAG: hypothetical protein F6J92_05205 [Symploca sp. SIO1A3]|nr:hypothetical protein [Symploca sp. SIO1A3]